MAEDRPSPVAIRERLVFQALLGEQLKSNCRATLGKNKPEEVRPSFFTSTEARIAEMTVSFQEQYQTLAMADLDKKTKTKDSNMSSDFLACMAECRELVEDLRIIKQVYICVKSLRRQVDNTKALLSEEPDMNTFEHISMLKGAVAKLEAAVDLAVMDPSHPLIAESEELFRQASRVTASLSKDPRVKVESTTFKSEGIDSLGNIKFTHTAPPMFSGKIKHWTGFWEEFLPIHQTKKYTDQDKLKLFRDAMQDKTLKVQIANCISQGMAYQKVVQEVTDQFDNPRAQHKICLERAWELKPMVSTKTSMLTVVNEMQRIITGLEKLGSYDAPSILTHMVEKLLPPDLYEKWDELTSSVRKVPPIERLLQFLKERAFMSQYNRATPAPSAAAAPSPKAAKPKIIKQKTGYSASSHPVTTTPVETTPATPTPKSNYPPCRYQCQLCPEKHYPYNCSIFKSKTPSQRKAYVTEQTLCIRCLRAGHDIDACKSKHNCHKCDRAHNTLLHLDNSPPAVQSSSLPIQAELIRNTDDVQTSVSLAVSQTVPVNDISRKKFAATCMAKATGPTGRTVPVRIFLDPGSEITAITTRVARQLQLRYNDDLMAVVGFASKEKKICKTTQLTLTSDRDKEWSLNISSTVTDFITRHLPAEEVSSARSLEGVDEDNLADPAFDQPGDIQILAGQAICPYIVRASKSTGPLTILDTVFGDAITGSLPREEHSSVQTATVHRVTAEHVEPHLSGRDRVLNQTISRFWEVEQPIMEASKYTPEEERVQDAYMATHKYMSEEGRYQVTLPRKAQYQELGESRSTALRRYISNEKSLQRKGTLEAFQKEVRSYVELDHARLVTAEELKLPASQSFYLPMHGVVKESSSTTRLRVVFDGSCKSSTGVSFNDTLAVGPMLHPTLEEILLRFRSYRVALNGDISKMYRAILLDPADQQYHRFLWRTSPGGVIQDYCMRRVTFGVASSPYVAVRTLQQACHDFGQECPLAQKHIQHSFDVDDLLGGADTAEEALEAYKQIDFVLRKAGFILRKVRSNSDWVISHIPPDLRDDCQKKQLVDSHSTSYSKALGVVWEYPDIMRTDVTKPYNFVPTKRGILSDVAKTFDVMGWLTPVILPMKLLIQELWKSKKDWDEPISQEQSRKHQIWRDELTVLAHISIPRSYFEMEPSTRIHIHAFCDASLVAYGTVIYIQSEYESRPPTCRLVTAKSKVAPLSSRTITELELCAAVLLTTVVQSVCTSLSIPLENVTAWGDSQVVLCWLRRCPADYKTFVANRIATITRVIPASQWKHISTTLNSADCSSRGISAAELRDHNLWWTAPPWLTETESEPEQPLEEELAQYQEEHKKQAVMTATCNIITASPSDWLTSRTKSLKKLVRITAWLKRAAYNFLAILNKQPRNRDKLLTVEELQEATLFLQKESQQRSYPAELNGLSSNPPVPIPEANKLIHLAPFLHKNGLLRVGGRLRKSELKFSQSHPILLSVKDPLTTIIFQSVHQTMKHCGPTLLLATVGLEYFVVGAKRLAKKTCRECVTCRKVSAKAEHQLMADLPENRVTESPCFNTVGIDYAGPFLVKTSKLRTSPKVKTWLVIFICFASKGVNLELVSEQTTEGFLRTMNRFVSKWGMPKHVYTDNGTNFVGAKRELESFYQWMETSNLNSQLQSFFTEHKATWHCSPQRAPHFGGLWEAAVKSAKYHMKRVIGPHILTFEELETVFVQIQACLNSRPLIDQQSHNTDGVQPITPAHLLIGKSLVAYPERDIDPKATCRSRYLLCQQMVQSFWKSWTEEYLVLLQRRNKWTHSHPNLEPGDIVLMKDGTEFKTQWSLAKVTRTFPGDDGHVRVVEVKACKIQLPRTGPPITHQQMRVKQSTLRRPVSKLALLVKHEADPSSGGGCLVQNPGTNRTDPAVMQ